MDNQVSNNSTPAETIHVPQDSNQLPNLIADITPSPKPHVSAHHQAAQQQSASQQSAQQQPATSRTIHCPTKLFNLWH